MATPGDLIRLLALRLRLSRTDVPDLLRGPDVATIDALTTLGFSNRSIQRFFRPLVGGIQLDPSLHTSARMFDTILKMLFTGRAAVPRHGMKTISQQLGSRLPSSSVHVHVPVRSVTASAWYVPTQERLMRQRSSSLRMATRPLSCSVDLDTPAFGRMRLVRRTRSTNRPALNCARRRSFGAGVKCCGHVKRVIPLCHQAGTSSPQLLRVHRG